MPEFNSDLQVGIELEYPTRRHTDEALRCGYRKSQSVERAMRERMAEEHQSTRRDHEWKYGGKITSDISVGLELTSGPRPGRGGGIPIQEAVNWYRDSIDYVEAEGHPHEPVGTQYGGSQTAGTHIHFSHPDTQRAEGFAQWLYEKSQEPWLQTFVGSTIADQGASTAKVFRGTRHVKFMDPPPGVGRPNAVNAKSRASGHYEWRLPEPMVPEHFPLVMKFLDRAIVDTSGAEQWARDLVYSGDDRLTAIQRANAVEGDVREVVLSTDDGTLLADAEVQVTRSKFSFEHPEARYVREGQSYPYIYQVQINDAPDMFESDVYYVLNGNVSRNDTPTLGQYSDTIQAFLSPPDDGSNWVVRPTETGEFEVLHPEDDMRGEAIVDAFRTVTNGDEGDETGVETSRATEVLIEALA